MRCHGAVGWGRSGMKRMGRRWALVLALLATACALNGGTTAAGGFGDRAVDLRVDGVQRSYLVHVPRAAPPAGFPVVLAFHGGGGRARSMIRLTGLDALADRRGFIVAYPDGIDRHWNDGRSTIKVKSDDVGFVAAVLDDLERRFPVDARRIYATGISNGGIFSERLGCDLSNRIAAIAPVSGTMPADLAPSCRPARPVSLLQIGGTADPIMPYGGGAVADFGGRGEGGQVLSDQRTAALWADLDGCAGPSRPEALAPIAAPDGTGVVRTRFAPCRPGAVVTLLTVEGGGHTWPGGAQYLPAAIVGRASRQLDASAAIVDFFLSRPPR